MEIHVNRNGQSFGPYEESEARALYASGNIAATDLVWREGMAEWQKAAQLFGEPVRSSAIPPAIPSQAPSTPQVPPVPGYAAPQSSSLEQVGASASQLPPQLHWALVLLFGVLSLGIFIVVWTFIQSTWVRKIDRTSNATTYLICQLALTIVAAVMDTSDSSGTRGMATLVQVLSYVFYYCGYYSMRRSMIDYFNNVEPIQLQMSRVMVFLFSIFYLQHHMTRIAKWRTAGHLRPQ